MRALRVIKFHDLVRITKIFWLREMSEFTRAWRSDMKVLIGYETGIIPPFGPDLDPQTLTQAALSGKHFIESIVTSAVQPGSTDLEEAEKKVSDFFLIHN